MTDNAVHPFDSIESALEFMILLDSAASEAASELQAMLGTPLGFERYTEAVILALFKVNTLASHIQKSRRILNDLRMIRKVLVREAIMAPRA